MDAVSWNLRTAGQESFNLTVACTSIAGYLGLVTHSRVLCTAAFHQGGEGGLMGKQLTLQRRVMAGLAAIAAVVVAIGLVVAAPTAHATAGAVPLAPFTQCPAVGASPSCKVLLVVNPDGTVSVYSDPSVGDYDGGDDTLVGIWNTSGKTVDAVTVNGPGSDLAGFDDDGLCTYGISGCPFGPTGYEGPGTSFVTNAADPDTAEVDFTGGLADGASAYFSLEGTLTSAVLSARQGHLGLSFTPTSGKPGTLFVGTYTCGSGTPAMTVVNNNPAATATSDIAVHRPVIGTGSTYKQTVIIGREGDYTAEVSCGDVQLGTAVLHVEQTLTYAGLGDSYSSGQGAGGPNYIPPSNGTLNDCHRAITAWPMRIRTATNTTIDFAACSGAVTDDFQSFNNREGKGFEIPQRDHISSSVTTLASLSVGGNDIGFPYVLTACIQGPRAPGSYGCASRIARKLPTALSWLTNGRPKGCVALPGINAETGQPEQSCYDHSVPSLHALYQDLAARVANGGRLVVTGYPKLFGNAWNASVKGGGRLCNVGSAYTISAADASWLNQAGDQLNSTILGEVRKAQAWAATNRPDVTIRYAPDSFAFEDHRLCDTKTAWINGLIITGPLTDLHPAPESFHPTPDGHAAVAAFIRPAFG
jgi:GDSL-like Lipase/Acylhydrolase family